MTSNKVKSKDDSNLMIDQPAESCELNLSADRKWLRFVVEGKQIASFHINYVNKVLGNSDKTATPKSPPKDSEFPANL